MQYMSLDDANLSPNYYCTICVCWTSSIDYSLA